MLYNGPAYRQIAWSIGADILSGRRQPGERLPAIRKLANMYQVNPNTIQRALQELKGEKLIRSFRKTVTITEDITWISAVRESWMRQVIRRYLSQEAALGYKGHENLFFFPEGNPENG